MYVDESGDCGINNSPTRYYILSAIVFHELRWKDILTDLVDFRRHLKTIKGLKIREEIHCTSLISRPGPLVRIKRHERLDIIKHCIRWLGAKQDINIFSVVVDKQGRTDDIFEVAWSALITRYENTISYDNFVGNPQNWDDTGIIISDDTDGQKLRRLLRKMRHFNPVPNRVDRFAGGLRNLKIQYLIEDPIFRESKHSLMHQMSDVVAYCLKQKYHPNSYMKSKAACNLYSNLDRVLSKAVSKNRDGIVKL